MILVININGNSIPLCGDIPQEVTSLDIQFFSPVPVVLDNSNADMVRHWLTTLINRCTCEYVSYNNCLTLTSDAAEGCKQWST